MPGAPQITPCAPPRHLCRQHKALGQNLEWSLLPAVHTTEAQARNLSGEKKWEREKGLQVQEASGPQEGLQGQEEEPGMEKALRPGRRRPAQGAPSTSLAVCQ